MSTSTDTHRDPGPAPAWLVELLEVLELRRRTLLLGIGGVALAGLLVALLLPDYLPPRPDVGAAVGLAAVLLGVAITFGLDSLDLKVRGPRHVRSSGGLLAQQLTGVPSPDALSPVVATLHERAQHADRVLVGLSPIDVELDAEGWQDALCGALADTGLRVLTVDLQRPAEDHPGVVEVAEGRTTLADAVTFDDERMVARLGPGGDPVAALGGLRTVVGRLPSDIDVLVVLLPPPSGGGVLGAASVLDHVYVLAEVDRTARVDLIAALDAFDAVQATSEVLLIAGTAADAAPDEPAADEAAPGPTTEPATEPVDDPADDPAGDPAGDAADGPVLDAPGEPAPEASKEPAPEPALEQAGAPDLEPPAEPSLAEPAPQPAPDPAAPEPVVESPDREDPQLRLTMAEAAVELAGLAELDRETADQDGEEPVDTPAEDIDEGDPTVETPPVVIDPQPEREPERQPERQPEREPEREPEPVVAAAPEPAAPAPEPVRDEPFADQPDLPEDPERIAAAMQGLGYGLWSPSPRVPSAPHG